MMLQRFIAYNKKNNLFSVDDKILLAISGGIDSIVMLDLFCKASLNCAIVHVNFSLRAEESDGDEQFVRNLANEYDFPIFVHTFDTSLIAEQESLSIQETARNLRYKWFEEIRASYEFDHIAVAHNKNDIIETFHINLARGTGLKGLTGIKAKNGYIIRPLLFATRFEIEEYCIMRSLQFREDSSNLSDKYARNKIRKHITPVFEKINPSYLETMSKNIEKLNEAHKILNDLTQKIKQNIWNEKENAVSIHIPKLIESGHPHFFLHEMLEDFDFHSKTIEQIAESLTSQSGKTFFARNFKIVKDREFLIIEKIGKEDICEYYIHEYDSFIEVQDQYGISGFNFSFEEFSNKESITRDAQIACLDSCKIKFPLKIRKWKEGDIFHPLGMKQKKKLSDFFIDKKLSLPQKEKVWIFETENVICWISGLRIDDRFKVNEQTQSIFKISFA